MDTTNTLTEVMAANDWRISNAFEEAIAEQVAALVESGIGCETWQTGGGCTAVVTTDGVTDVVLTTMDGDYLFGVYRTSAEHPDVSGWYPEQSIWGDYPSFDADMTGDDIAAIFAALVDEFVTQETPYRASADALGYVPTTSYHFPIREQQFASVEEALDWASSISTWADGTDPHTGATLTVDRVTVRECRTGLRAFDLKFGSRETALEVFETAIGR